MLTNEQAVTRFLNKNDGDSGNVHSIGYKLFSYHTCIGQWQDDILYINTTVYSMTTSKNHQSPLYELALGMLRSGKIKRIVFLAEVPYQAKALVDNYKVPSGYLIELRDFIKRISSLDNVTLSHDEVDDLFISVDELHNATLTRAGKSAHRDVLKSNINMIYNDGGVIYVILGGCTPKELKDFTNLLSGYVSEDLYNKYVR